MSYNNGQKNEVMLPNTSTGKGEPADFFDVIYKKAYRLSTAVYLVSNLMSDKEELKTKIKNLALDLVSVSVSMKDLPSIGVLNTIGNIEKKSLELMSLLDIAANAGLISGMNASIIRTEFDSFLGEISSYSENLKYLKSGFIKSVFSKPHSDVANIAKVPNLAGDRAESLSAISDDVKISNAGNGYKGHKRKDVRRELIMDFIKRHDGSSIKDISPNIRGCSEKTVQREIIELIKSGLVRKEGERRWSRYYAIN